ncbi:MAG: hypothetical protein ABSB22_01835 [Thermodesulfobacteriota bacterium]|jgi:hypothetical protein
MELKPLSPQLQELRNAIISSNLTSCYLVLDELISSRGERLFYDKFRKEWLDVYKEIYDLVSKMKTRKSSRRDAEIMKMAHRGPKRKTK